MYKKNVFKFHLFLIATYSVLLSYERLCLYTKSVHSIVFLHALIDKNLATCNDRCQHATNLSIMSDLLGNIILTLEVSTKKD